MPAEKMPEELMPSLASPPGSAVSTPTASPSSSIVKEMHELDEESVTPRLLAALDGTAGTTAPGKPVFAASPSLRDMVSPRTAGPTKQTPATTSVRLLVLVLMLVGLLVFELAAFELRDWNDAGRPWRNGFTGPAVVWALSVLWVLSQAIHAGLHRFTTRFSTMNEGQKMKVVKYCIQVTWGSAMALAYGVAQLRIDGVLGECASAADAEACTIDGAFPLTHTLTLFGSMYMWELVHEGVLIHDSLAVHHLCIVVMWHVSVGYYGTRSWIEPAQLKAIAVRLMPLSLHTLIGRLFSHKDPLAGCYLPADGGGWPGAAHLRRPPALPLRCIRQQKIAGISDRLALLRRHENHGAHSHAGTPCIQLENDSDSIQRRGDLHACRGLSHAGPLDAGAAAAVSQDGA